MDKLTIKRIFVNDKKKSGEPYITKAGKPYWLITIYAEGEEKCFYSNAWDEKQAEEWRTRTGEIEGIVERGEFNRFKFPNKQDNADYALADFKARVDLLTDRVVELEKRVFPPEVDTYNPDKETFPEE